MTEDFYKKIKTLYDSKEELTEERRKILVHCCCAVCFGYPSQFLKMLGYIPVAYFYNPNIYPKSEHDRRRDELGKYCKKYDFEYYEEEFKPEVFYDVAKGLENEPERGKRCDKCFKLRLLRAASKAKELGISRFTTTLSVSPHKVSENIFEQGFSAAKEAGIEFAPFNFKKNNGFNITQKIADYNNMYKQTYCGCEFSVRKPEPGTTLQD